MIWKRLIYQGKDFGDYYLVSDTEEIKNAKTDLIRKKILTMKDIILLVLV